MLFQHESLRFHPMPPWITKESHRPRVSHRTMSYRLAGRITVTLVSFQETDGAVTTVEMEPQAGRTLSPIHTTKRSNGFLKKTTRRSRVHVQTIGLNAETKKLRHRADAAICLLTFPFIGLLRLRRLRGLRLSVEVRLQRGWALYEQRRAPLVRRSCRRWIRNWHRAHSLRSKPNVFCCW
jgi:hypothetical protein